MNQMFARLRNILGISLSLGSVYIFFVFGASGQQIKPPERNCSMFGSVEAQRGKPLLVGPKFQAPDLRFRFTNLGNRSENLPKVVRIFYIWNWLEYPYPEHSWGYWNEESDIIDCTNSNIETVIPAYHVVPKGWYSGKFARTPQFDHIEVAFDIKDCSPRILFSKKEIAKFRTATAEVSLSCGVVAKYKFVKK